MIKFDDMELLQLDLCMQMIKNGKKVFSSKILFIKHIGNSSSIAIDPKLKDIADKFYGSKSYLRFIENSLRKDFNFSGLPIKILFKTSQNPYSAKTNNFKN